MKHIKPVSKAASWFDTGGDTIEIITALLGALGPIITAISNAISNSKASKQA